MFRVQITAGSTICCFFFMELRGKIETLSWECRSFSIIKSEQAEYPDFLRCELERKRKEQKSRRYCSRVCSLL